MASRTKRKRQRNATRKKNRDARRAEAFAVCGLPHLRASVLDEIAEAPPAIQGKLPNAKGKAPA